jgi:glycosyltransferase involved in cell wall biosynthesis
MSKEAERGRQGDGATADDLAIVIPAWKRRHLHDALASIASQTDQRFRLYVCDDASPEDLREVLAQFAPAFGDRVVYHRFAANLGGKSLVGQWTRCIEMTREPWVWLFSDDDVMEPGCVAAFHAARHTTGERFDVYRFNSLIIDGEGRVVGLCPPHPENETWYDFTYHLLSGWRRPNQQELVFRRAVLHRIGGFRELPLAWFADFAFAIAAIEEKGARTIAGPHVHFRLGGDNISSTRGAAIDQQKQLANQQFVDWLLEFVESHDCGGFPGRGTLRALVRQTYLTGLDLPKRWVGLRQGARIVPFMRDRLGIPAHEAWIRIWYYNARTVWAWTAFRTRRLLRFG